MNIFKHLNGINPIFCKISGCEWLTSLLQNFIQRGKQKNEGLKAIVSQLYEEFNLLFHFYFKGYLSKIVCNILGS